MPQVFYCQQCDKSFAPDSTGFSIFRLLQVMVNHLEAIVVPSVIHSINAIFKAGTPPPPPGGDSNDGSPRSALTVGVPGHGGRWNGRQVCEVFYLSFPVLIRETSTDCFKLFVILNVIFLRALRIRLRKFNKEEDLDCL